MLFFTGVHQVSDAKRVDRAFVSVRRLAARRHFVVNEWIMDSGAFTELLTHGGYRSSVVSYAAEIRRWRATGKLLAAVTQDYMCEPMMLDLTGGTVLLHQRMTIERYDALCACDTGDVYVMPVLQGYLPAEYVAHVEAYGDRLRTGMWVGVGSVCKRNGDVAAVEQVLAAILAVRPDLRLHGFGIKITSLASGLVRDALYSADSMAWSFAARKQGRNPNDWREAVRFAARIETMPVQECLLL